MTITKGAHAVKGFNGDMTVMDSRIAITKKYTFANRINCKNKALGRKLNNEYFDVRTKLDSN